MAQTMAEHLIEQGKVQEKQAAVLKLLRLGFNPVPESLINQITLIRGPAQLDSLFEKAFTSQTLDEVDLQNHDG